MNMIAKNLEFVIQAIELVEVTKKKLNTDVYKQIKS